MSCVVVRVAQAMALAVAVAVPQSVGAQPYPHQPIRIIVASGHRTVEITDIPDGSMFFSKPYAYDVIETAIQELLA